MIALKLRSNMCWPLIGTGRKEQKPSPDQLPHSTRAVTILGKVFGCVSRRCILLLLGSNAAFAQDATGCAATLRLPAADLSLSFPQQFSWVPSASCQNGQLAFATSGNLPEIAYVPDGFANPHIISTTEWALIQNTLDPAGVADSFYWTVVDADATSFLELAPWRPFYAHSRVSAISGSPGSGASNPVDQDITVHLNVSYDTLSAGILQAWIKDPDSSLSQKSWTAIPQPSRGTKTFDFTFKRSLPGSRDYTITCQFRASAAAGPLADVRPTDAVRTLSPYTVIWQIPADTTAPSVVINSPATDPRFPATDSPTTIAGSASDNIGVSEVRWANDRGGSGTATGTANWNASVALQSGLNNITITARDASGNTNSASVSVMYAPPDKSPPTISVTSPSSAGAYSTANPVLDLAGTAADNTGVTQVNWSSDLGGGGSAIGTSNWSVGSIPLQPGQNIITVAARDAAGNSANSVLTVTYTADDSVSPAVTIVSPTPQESYTTSDRALTLSGRASGNPAVIQVTWKNNRGGSGTAAGILAWSINSITLQPGVNTISVTARDAKGSTAIAILDVTCNALDPDSPTIRIKAPTELPTFSTTEDVLNLTGYASGKAGISQVSWSSNRGGSGDAIGTTSWISTNIPLQPGLNKITVLAWDLAGNTASTFLSVTYTVTDTVKPIIAIISPNPSETPRTTKGTIDLAGAAFDDKALSQVKWSNDRGGNGIAKGTVNWSITDIALQPGLNTITVMALDAHDNSASAKIKVAYDAPDSLAPTVVITSPASALPYSSPQNTLSLAGMASDNIGVAQVSWSNDRGGAGSATGTAAWSVDNIVLQPGLNNIRVTARDAAGNSSSQTLTVAYGPLGNGLPIVAITSPTIDSTFTAGNVYLSLGGTAWADAGLTQVAWKNHRGGSGIAQGTSNWKVTDLQLQPGLNIITVTGENSAGATASTTLAVVFLPSDTTPPNLVVNSLDADLKLTTSTSSITLSGTVSDDVGVDAVTWSNDRGGSGIANGTSQWLISGILLQPGPNKISVVAQDTSGNRFQQTVTATRTSSDSVAPSIKITGPTTESSYSTNDGFISISGESSDDNDDIKIISWSNDRGGGGVADGLTSWRATGIPLETGKNVLTFTVSDASGKTSSQTLAVSYLPRDETPPTLEITSPTAESTLEIDAAQIKVGGSASDNDGVAKVTWSNDRGGGGVATGTSDWFVEDIVLRRGLNVLQFTAFDFSGHATSKTLAVTSSPPDHVGPAIQVTYPTSGQKYTSSKSSVRLGGTASDDGSVARVVWVGDRAGSGIANGTTIWGVDDVPLFIGDNTFTIIATDDAGNNSTVSLTVTYDPNASSTSTNPDPKQPDTEPRSTNPDPTLPDEETGKQEILLQSTSGDLACWVMDGTTISKATVLFHVSPGWRVVGYADFNDDGEKDLVVQHLDGTVAFWFLKQLEIVQTRVLYRLPEGWRVSAVADFNGDGQADLVSQSTGGLVAVWLMKGAEISDASVPLKLNEDWHITGTGDFNHDQNTDLVLQGPDGSVAFWLMAGTRVSSEITPYSLPAGWHISGAGRFNSSGDTDLVLQNTDGSVGFWLMNGTTVTAGVVPYQISAEWEIVSPR